MNEDLNIILKRLNKLFSRISGTRYWVVVANDHYDKAYNFFFHQQRPGQRCNSVPLHSINTYNLEYLETIIYYFKLKNQLTINFVGFSGLRWPDSQRLIQRKRDILE